MLTSPVNARTSQGNAALQSAASASPTTPILAGATSGPSSAGSGASSSTGSGKALALTPTDFINMMITQLKNQDPMQPASNADLLQQMSQIGQLQSSDSLQTSLKGMVLQNQIGSASNLIGKSVKGMDANSNPVSGTVNSIHVQSDGVALQLDDGTSLPLGNVTDIDTAGSGAGVSGAGVSGAGVSGAGASGTRASSAAGATTTAATK